MNTKISDLTKYFEIKQDFQKLFCKTLGLNMIESPIAIENNIEYLQDNLTGIEEPVRFKNYQFVHSLAKWKRFMLKDCEIGTGICTNMYGVRQNEELDNIHSYFVRQWDWEKIIEKEDRNINTLIEYVDKIYYCIKTIVEKYSSHKLPDNIQYISNKDLKIILSNLSKNIFCYFTNRFYFILFFFIFILFSFILFYFILFIIYLPSGLSIY